MTDNYTQYGGPLGIDPETLSTDIGRVCITITFDSKGRIEATCTNLAGPILYLLDPVTLEKLASMRCPTSRAEGNPATNTTGGAYFYLDDAGPRRRRDRRPQDHRRSARRQRPGAGVRAGRRLRPDAVPGPDGERMPSALPDTQGRYWFVGRTKGTVGVLDPRAGAATRSCSARRSRTPSRSASDGVYVVTDKAMYKFRTGSAI